MPAILRQQVPWKQIEGRIAGFAVEYLDPEKGFYRYILVAVEGAGSPVVAVDLGTECGDEGVRRPFVGANVEVLDLLADDPGGHRVDVEAFDVAANAVCLDQWRTTTDERVDDPQAGKVIRLEKGLFQVVVAEFREDETTKQGSRTAGEPLVNTGASAIKCW